jgi:hypothetical protein
VLAQDAPVWFVTDGERLLKRFEDGFAREVLERFDVVRDRRFGARAAFHRQPPLPATTWITPFAPVAFTDWLTLTRLAHSEATPGGELIVRTDWRVAEDQDAPTISVQLVSEDGTRPAATDGLLAEGVINPGQAEGTPIPDTKSCACRRRWQTDSIGWRSSPTAPNPPHCLPSRSRSPGSGSARRRPPPRRSARWRNGIELTGAMELPATLARRSPSTLRVRWQSAAPLTEEYTAFVHLIGPDGAIVAQDDHAPRHGFWPTTGWRSGVAVDDAFTLTLPASIGKRRLSPTDGLVQRSDRRTGAAGGWPRRPRAGAWTAP